jgi:hypothetical protein
VTSSDGEQIPQRGWTVGHPVTQFRLKQFEQTPVTNLQRYEGFRERYVHMFSQALSRLWPDSVTREVLEQWTELIEACPLHCDERTAILAAHRLLSFAGELQGLGGLVELLGKDLQYTIERRFSTEWFSQARPREELNRLDRLLNLSATGYLGPEAPDAYREVAAHIIGADNLDPNFAPALHALLDLESHGRLSDYGEDWLVSYIDRWTTTRPDRSPPKETYLPQIFAYLRRTPVSAKIISLEAAAWHAFFLWKYGSWTETELEKSFIYLTARTESFLSRSLGPDPQHLAAAASNFALKALDCFISLGQVRDAIRWIERLVSRSLWDVILESPYAIEASAITETLCPDNRATVSVLFPVPAPELLRDLITADCRRATIYLTIAHFLEKFPTMGPLARKSWVSPDEVSAIKIAYSAAVSSWNDLLARAFQSIVNPLLAMSGGVPVSRTDDVATLNIIAKSLMKDFLPERNQS